MTSFALLAGALSAEAREKLRSPNRALTITRNAAPQGGRTGIQALSDGTRVVAWGGFSANGYGWGPPNSERARRAASNASVRYRTAGVYGYGVDGLGGTFADDDGRIGRGYNNPHYGNAYNAYIGVPTALEFGPGFASRHITDSDDADNEDATGPEPEELGFGVSRVALNPDE